MDADLTLGPVARQRAAAALPGLLAIVQQRGRRRRRRRMLAATAVPAAIVAGLLLWPKTGPSTETGTGRAAATAATPGWQIIAGDLGVLERCRLVVVDRPDWHLDDKALQAALATAGRPAGIVRIGERVRVDPRALDVGAP